MAQTAGVLQCERCAVYGIHAIRRAGRSATTRSKHCGSGQGSGRERQAASDGGPATRSLRQGRHGRCGDSSFERVWSTKTERQLENVALDGIAVSEDVMAELAAMDDDIHYDWDPNGVP